MDSCRRCLLDSRVPGVSVEGDGLCSVCHAYDRDWGDWPAVREQRLEALQNIVTRVKRKRRAYDCLVPLSGGKDSVYVLYFATEVLRLRCLGITFDNGFLSATARENTANACRKLSVDHIFFQLNWHLLSRLYRHFFLTTGFFCPVCMRGIYVATSKLQQAFRVPIALKGTCRRTEEHVSREFFVQGDPGFFQSVVEDTPLAQEAEQLARPLGVFRGPRQIKLPDYVDWEYDTIFETIRRELDWNADSANGEHQDCQAAPVVDYIRWRKFPALVPEMLRYSKLVTAGLMSRKEAMEHIENRGFSGEEPATLDWFLGELGITRSDFEAVLASPLQHLKFFERHRSRSARRLAAIKDAILPRWRSTVEARESESLLRPDN